MARPFRNRKRRAGNGNLRYCQGFGQFEGAGIVDQAAYAWSTDSCEYHSNEAWGNSVTLVRGPFTNEECRDVTLDDEEKLNRVERRFIKRQAAALVHQSSDGFITVEWTEDADEARKAFDRLEKEYYPEDEEDEA